MSKVLIPLLLLAGFALPVFADDCPEPDAAGMAEVQAKMMATMGPGPEHELLSKMVGDWEGQSTVWPMAGMAPMTSPVSAHWESVLGGRFIQGKLTGSMMGMPIESLGMMGFDRRHELYTMIGFDNMGTYYITASGKYDKNTRTMNLSGTDEEPIGGLTQVYDFKYEFVDDNTFVMSLIFHCPTFGAKGPHKMMETKMTRKKS